MDPKKIKRMIESVFSFDYLGDTLGQLRADLENEELKKTLTEKLTEAAKNKIGDKAEAAVIEELCAGRVEQFIESAKATRGSGCGA